ncbi:hypothetical protein LCGC14_3130210, partial [marine sediment metagenome]
MNHYSYRICGLRIESTIHLPELPLVNGKAPDFRFEVLNSRKLPNCHWVRQFTLDDGDPWLMVGGNDANFHLRFPDMAHFQVDTLAKQIQCHPLSDVATDAITHL